MLLRRTRKNSPRAVPHSNLPPMLRLEAWERRFRMALEVGDLKGALEWLTHIEDLERALKENHGR